MTSYREERTLQYSHLPRQITLIITINKHVNDTKQILISLNLNNSYIKLFNLTIQVHMHEPTMANIDNNRRKKVKETFIPDGVSVKLSL